MKNSIYLILSALLITIAANAQAPDNNASGAGVIATGMECDLCHANASSAPLQASKSYDALLPDSNPVNGTEGDTATGSK